METPNSPSELFAIQAGKVREEINSEGATALLDLMVDEILPELNPNMNQVLALTKRFLEDLEFHHFTMIESGDLDNQSLRLWKRDRKSITRALMALRQVAES